VEHLINLNAKSSLNIIRVIKSRKMRLAGHVWKKEECIQFYDGKARKKQTLGKTQT
jgi:hypothetical protein